MTIATMKATAGRSEGAAATIDGQRTATAATDVSIERSRTLALDEDALWEFCLSSDTSMDGVFFVAVRTTGVYCRPSCSARKPKRENVSFFADADGAEAAGYRACKRCHPRLSTSDGATALVQVACDLLEDDRDGEPLSVPQVAKRLGVPQAQLQRTFKRALGVTPRQYAEARRLARLKGGLREGRSVTDAMYDAGYSSSSRLYESAGDQMGMTPATYRRGGRGLSIRYTIVACPLGRMLVAATDRGVCAVHLADTDAELGVALRGEFSEAVIEPDAGALQGYVDQILEHLAGVRPRMDIPLDIQGTAFQMRVWKALREIAYGATKTYGDIAAAIGSPKAMRAVGNACHNNPVPVIIPCHRVVAANGLGGYGGGIERKVRLLETERRVAESMA
jgi:AraC family transcriptional regulator of adaptative response/methylated-DNA-[protein]-cysteine methyltransferase